MSFLKDPLFLHYWSREYLSRRQDEDRLSVRTSGGGGSKRNLYSGRSFMFIEDFHIGIMPFMLKRGEREKYKIHLNIKSPEKERLIANGISGRSYNMFLGDALCDFVRNTAQTLLLDGKVFYEIVYKKNKDEKIEEFDLVPIQPHFLFRFFNYYLQIIPWWEAKKIHTKVQIVKIPREKILEIKFPKQLGGPNNIRKITKRLSELSKEVFPKFQMQAMEEGRDIGFDVKKYYRAKELEIAKLTKNFGWNQRKTSENFTTEYYSMLRFLRTKQTEAIIREHIIAKLNKKLNQPPLNLNVNIVVENLFTVKDVVTQREKLKVGSVKFTDIFNSLDI